VAKYGKVLADFVRSLDGTRPVTQGSAMGQAFFFTLAADAADWTYLDLADTHYQNDLATSYHNSVLPLHDGHPDKALVVGEAWHQEIYDDWNSVTDHPWAIGTFSWTGWDYLGESGAGVPRIYPIGDPPPAISLPALPYPWISSYQGDHDLIGQAKPQLYWKRVVWGDSDLELAVERPAPDGYEQRTLVWSYYDELQSWTWPGREGKDLKVRVYTTGDEVKLYLNGKQVAGSTVTDADKRAVAFTVPYTPGTLTAIATRRGREIGHKSFVTAGAPAKIRLTPEERTLSSDPGSLGHILVEIVDAHNRLVPDAVVRVTVKAGGDAARLAALGCANPHYVDSYQSGRRYTYHGQALAVVRTTGVRGRVEISASAPNLKSTSLSLRVG
jgi:beta-galactosidase